MRAGTCVRVAAALLLWMVPGAVRAAAQEPQARAAFIDSYCVGCHGPELQKSGFRIDRLPDELDELNHAATLEKWWLVLEYVEQSEMPPPKAPRHPSAAERAGFVTALRAHLDAATRAASPVGTPLRRLNRTEHLNTLRDLFGIRGLELPGHFPEDGTGQSFDTLAESQFFSAAHLDACLALATDVADRMVPLPDPEQRRSVSGHEDWGLNKLSWRRHDDPEACYFTGVNIAGWGGAVWDDTFRAPSSGLYRVRLRVNAEAPTGQDGRPLRLAFHALQPAHYDRPDRANRADLPRVAELEVTNLQPEVLTCMVPLEAGESFHVYCENRLARSYPERGPNRWELGQLVIAARKLAQPTVRIERMEITGPAGPLPRQVQFLVGGSDAGSAPADERAPERFARQVRGVLLPLAERAYRRPLSPSEQVDLIDPVLRHRGGDGSPGTALAHAVHYGIRRILTAPQFLFIGEGRGDAAAAAGPASGRLDDHGLASRLSYFLWSSLPDAPLLALAADGRLSDPEVLGAQVLRMLDDPRAARFVTRFTGQWLGNRDAATVMVCDLRHTWSELIRYGYLRSTELFFGEILERNLSIRNFIDSSFTYANEPMQIAWDFPGEHPAWDVLEDNQVQSLVWPEPVRLDLDALPPGTPAHVAGRGGVLGLSSVLISTGDGVESSPILRGVWVLDNLFGTPVPPPPADVPALVPDLSRARSVREVLAAHQASDSCARCHVRIDPVGLALENYDAVGNWRSQYFVETPADDSGQAEAAPRAAWVDAAAVLPDGTPLAGPGDIKAWLLARPALFTRCLATKLAEYACGRHLAGGDLALLDDLVAAEPPGGYGFRDLIVAVVLSETFATR